MTTLAICQCQPWQQRWKPETPGMCATCGRQFSPYSRAREVCLKSEGCLLLPDHEGDCYTDRSHHSDV